MRAIPMLVLLCSCEAGSAPEADFCADGGETYVFLMSEMVFARASDGVSEGFDLDGRSSDEHDDLGCEIEDYTSPEGAPGIDNAMARLLPALELTEAAAVEGLLSNAIASGELLIAVQLSNVRDLQDDPCVDLSIVRATGAPLVGTDGVLLSGQTIERDLDKPESSVADVALVGGRIIASPVTLEIPFNIFDVELNVVLHDGAIRVDVNEDGTASGVFAGGVEISSINDVAQNNDVDAALAAALEIMLSDAADLALDEAGECQQISVTFAFQGLPAWFYEAG